MRIETIDRFKRVILDPGEFHAAADATVISTLLGSCVSACLYDPIGKVIGMNHFLLSNRRYSRDLPLYVSEAGRYGIHAMELLINEMLKRGAQKRFLKAKVFGGANIMVSRESLGNFACVSEVNCRFIREFLKNENIDIVAEDLGKDHGRVIHFSNGDFAVYVRKIGQNRSQSLLIRDRDCWQKAIEMQEKTLPAIDIW
ncbi:chemotaxis protein CheD [Geotalea toluenoxydans]|uniref:chemotaxis protein CheD n=1 Tax=Geotalea toluenoxydans TaxID=421624 RepID=UPI0006D162CC|nr:chemotaxis protein CheD [Geotalea toluenoxydans]